MKKIKLLSQLALAITIFALGCAKDGAQGPVGATGATGATGPAGPTGATGATGTANVIFSSWATVGSLGAIIDSAITDFGTCKRFIRTAPSLTAGVLDSGLVISYWRVTTVIYSAIPYQFPVAAQTYFLGAANTPGKIIYFTSIFGAGAGWTPNSGAEVRYVIIRGAVSGGFSGGIGGTIYTAEQIKAMPYERVCELFKIPPSGEGWH